MTNSQKFTVQVSTPIDAPQEYYEHELQHARKEMGCKLFDILYSNKLPAVVDVSEEVFTDYGTYQYHSPFNHLRITATITPVSHRDITLAHYAGGYGLYQPEKLNIFQKLFGWIFGNK